MDTPLLDTPMGTELTGCHIDYGQDNADQSNVFQTESLQVAEAQYQENQNAQIRQNNFENVFHSAYGQYNADQPGFENLHEPETQHQENQIAQVTQTFYFNNAVHSDYGQYNADQHGFEAFAMCPIRKTTTDKSARLPVEPKVEYSCTHCDKKVHYKTSLNRHFFRAHSLEKPYTCAECQKSYAVKVDFHKHQKVCVWNEQYKCHYQTCGKYVGSADALRRHIRRHQYALPHKCYLCNGKQFADMWNYKRHMKIQHKKTETKT